MISLKVTLRAIHKKVCSQERRETCPVQTWGRVGEGVL